VKKEIARILKEAREERGESQAQLAERLGVTQQLVSRIERGQGSLEKVADLCRALGLRLALQIGGRSVVLVHPIHPEERKEIEENIDWYERLSPVDRLRVNARNYEDLELLMKAGRRGTRTVRTRS
jgi:transcriptional regulator with XRE-family HTH domain